MAGGHPRESLEASFDVVYEDHGKARQLLAETILVSSQVIGLFPRRGTGPLPFGAHSPMWYLRLNHTRLADSVLDLCGVPQKESIRRVCFHMLTRFTAPSPCRLSQVIGKGWKLSDREKGFEESNRSNQLSENLEEAIAVHGLPAPAADRFRAFVETCLPLPPDINDSIECLKRGIAKIRSVDDTKMEPRRAKRLEDAAKSLKSVKDLVFLLRSNLEPLIGSDRYADTMHLNRPLFVSLDLGLRQKRKHYHGGIIYQCIVLPDTFFETRKSEEDNDLLISATGRGMKVAEGGDFSELVRKYRPPGNFATGLVNYYTTAPIPMCAGVRFSIGKLVELAYLDAALSGENDSSGEGWNKNDLLQKSGLDREVTDVLRRCLGHPFPYSNSIQCVVASVNGMDASSTSERFLVASRLWAEGVSAEYLPQSGVMLSLLMRFRDEAEDSSSGSDWSLLELCGVCALLKIPFVVIVQPHLLKDKGSVRLRRVSSDAMAQGSTSTGIGNELFVSLDDLAVTIQDATGRAEEADDNRFEITPPIASGGREHHSSSRNTRVECILIDNDVYFGNDREVSKNETPHWKALKKTMKKIELSGESYVSSLQHSGQRHVVALHGTPVFAADISFWALRDFGTALMRRERQDHSASGAFTETAEQYPKFKRLLKTLTLAIDNYMKRHGIWTGHNNGSRSHHGNSSGSSLLTIFLYSKTDDRFDTVTLNSNSSAAGQSSSSQSRRR